MLVAVGVLLMIPIGWLGGWLVNTPPRVYQLSIPNLIWSLSPPIGTGLVVLGAAALAGAERRLFVWILGVSIGLLAWSIWRDLAYWGEPRPPSALFGVGGGLMMVFFLGAAREWAKRRAALSGGDRTAADLRLFGLAFILLAACELCGLLGAPVSLLRPALAASSVLADKAIPAASSMLVYMTLGFAFMFLASWAERGRGSAGES